MKKIFFFVLILAFRLNACPLCMHNVKQESHSSKKTSATAHHIACSCDCTQHRHNGIVCEKCGHKVKSQRHNYTDNTIKPRR